MLYTSSTGCVNIVGIGPHFKSNPGGRPKEYRRLPNLLFCFLFTTSHFAGHAGPDSLSYFQATTTISPHSRSTGVHTRVSAATQLQTGHQPGGRGQAAQYNHLSRRFVAIGASTGIYSWPATERGRFVRRKDQTRKIRC